jgi:thioredoxin reductase
LSWDARKIILATGLREKLPDVPGIQAFYGISLFSCPYCDGWEHKDEPLIVISETAHAFDLVKSVYPWSRRLALATNGHYVISREQRKKLSDHGIPVNEQKIAALAGRNGRLETVVFEDGTEERRNAGFVSPVWSHAGALGAALGCKLNGHGGIEADDFGRTSAHGVFAAGDAANIVPPQLIVAAADGCRAAIGVNSELTEEDF